MPNYSDNHLIVDFTKSFLCFLGKVYQCFLPFRKVVSGTQALELFPKQYHQGDA